MLDSAVEVLAFRAGGQAIQSESPGMFYIRHPDDHRIAVAAQGVVILTKKQALKLLEELPEIIKTYL